jgi:uncharacterized protein YkwD
MRRLPAWAASFFVLAVFSAAIVSAAHRPAAGSPGLTAARQTATGIAVERVGPQEDPPHVVPLPSPTPPAAARPPTSASGGTAPVQTRPPSTRPPSIVVRSTQQALINQDRAAHGLGALSWSDCLYSVALSNARRIAAQGYLSHTNGPQVDLTCHLGNRAGENIGYWSLGINDAKLNSMFMNSPEHYANIMGPYHYVATAWVVAANGYGYIAVEFS